MSNMIQLTGQAKDLENAAEKLTGSWQADRGRFGRSGRSHFPIPND